MPLRVNRRKRKNGPIFIVSFAVTLALLLGGTAFIILGRPSGVQTYHLPSEVPSYQEAWAKYVPENIVQFSMINYSLIRQLNASALPSTNLLDVIKPNISVTPDMVRAEESIQFSTPNATVSLVFLTSSAFPQFAAPVAEANAQTLSDENLMFISDVSINSLDYVGWMALIPGDHAVAFANGDKLGIDALNQALETANGTLPNLLQRIDVRQSLYVTNSTGGLLSIGIQNFAGLVQSGNMTTISVSDVGGTIRITNVVKFASSDFAKAQIGYMKSAYLSANSFAQYDQFLEAIQYQPFTDMSGAVRIVG